MSDTLLQRLLTGLRTAEQHNINSMSAPEVILWPDPERQWVSVVHVLQQHRPGLLVYGPYAPQLRQGPAIYLKCLLARTLPGLNGPEADWPNDQIPVIYLPGVSRQDLRPQTPVLPALQPLVEYLYTGSVWLQENGKEWTVLAMMINAQHGLGLNVATDKVTRDTLLRAVPSLLNESPADYTRPVIDADFLYERVMPNLVMNVLEWLNEGDDFLSRLPADQQALFTSICENRYRFKPLSQNAVEASARLGTQRDAWRVVWQQYASAPHKYPAIADLLRQAKPVVLTKSDPPESWPQVNEAEENTLRADLLKVVELHPAQAAEQLRALAEQHRPRRSWVWSDLGQAPLAFAVEELCLMAAVTAKPFPSSSLEDLTNYYISAGFKADQTMRRALATVRSMPDKEAVQAVIQALYRPWLENLAQKFQTLIEENSSVFTGQRATEETTEYVLFVDALRYELAREFKERLKSEGYKLTLSHGWSALPSLTPTAKPAVSPIAPLLATDSPFDEFKPVIASSLKTINTTTFRNELTTQEYAYVSRAAEAKAGVKGWQEIGDIDRKGHEEQANMVRRVDELYDQLREHLATIFEKGVRQVKIVTDHGWLLLPGGLPKAELPRDLAATRWGRCALLKDGVPTSLLQLPWRWNPGIFIAYAPGISFFKANEEYAHGGVSLQECLVPTILVENAAVPAQAARIKSHRWVNLRCTVELENAPDGYRVDIRTNASDEATSLMEIAGGLVKQGKASLFVDDQQEGNAAQIVLLDTNGRILDKKLTTVGDTH